MLPLEKRKPNRLRSYDYSQNGAYFLTICTKDMKCIFWNAQPGLIENPDGTSHLSSAGQAADAATREIPLHYSSVTVEKHVVMPNHLHMILLLAGDPLSHATDISQIIQQMKSAVTKKIGFAVWQRSFHDHIIRDEKEYGAIWDYIEANPVRWKEDCYYAGEQY
jgi:REP element-mobilizing transposase RayT